MSEYLSFSEIQRQFDSEWVLIEDPVTDSALHVKKGMVIWHSKDRDEVYKKARERKPRHSAILYTGLMPDDAAIIL